MTNLERKNSIKFYGDGLHSLLAKKQPYDPIWQEYARKCINPNFSESIWVKEIIGGLRDECALAIIAESIKLKLKNHHD